MSVFRSILALAALLAGSASAQVISSNTTWSGTVTLDRDVSVAPGVTLTVSPGAIITAATTDAANLGSNASKVEIIVQGTMIVNGATITSAGSSAGA